MIVYGEHDSVPICDVAASWVSVYHRPDSSRRFTGLLTKASRDFTSPTFSHIYRIMRSEHAADFTESPRIVLVSRYALRVLRRFYFRLPSDPTAGCNFEDLIELQTAKHRSALGGTSNVRFLQLN